MATPTGKTAMEIGVKFHEAMEKVMTCPPLFEFQKDIMNALMDNHTLAYNWPRSQGKTHIADAYSYIMQARSLDQENTVNRLPKHFLIRVMSTSSARDIQKTLLDMGYLWANTGPTSPRDKLRTKAPHRAIRAWTDPMTKEKWMVRIVSSTKLDESQRNSNIVKMAYAQLMSLRDNGEFRLNPRQQTDLKQDRFLDDETAASAIDYYLNQPKFIGVDMSASHTKKSWNFNSVNTSDIDFDDIAGSLSRQHPMAFVKGECHRDVKEIHAPEKEGDENKVVNVREEFGEFYVVVHNSLLDKAAVCGLLDRIPLGANRTKLNDGASFLVTSEKGFSAWQAWGKYVRGSRWPTRGHRKAIFKVTLASL